MKKARTSPEKAAAMDQEAVLAAKLAEHKNRSAGSKRAWIKIHAKRAATKAAAEAARTAVPENPAQALLVTGPAPENGSSGLTKRAEPASKFKEVICDVLRESPRTFKQLYTIIAERQPQYCTVIPSTNGKMVSIASMAWLSEMHRELREIAVINRDDGMWQLKEEVLTQFSAQAIENAGEPFLGRVGRVEIQTAKTQCTPSPSVVSESKENSKGRKPPGVRAKEGGTKLKRGAAVQVMTYPRPETKAVLVKAARENGQTVSSFMILAGLEKAARLQGCEIMNLVPQDELRQYL
jgi:hypothetical protein